MITYNNKVWKRPCPAMFEYLVSQNMVDELEEYIFGDYSLSEITSAVEHAGLLPPDIGSKIIFKVLKDDIINPIIAEGAVIGISNYLGYTEGDEFDNLEIRNELKKILSNCKNETTIKYLKEILE